VQCSVCGRENIKLYSALYDEGEVGNNQSTRRIDVKVKKPEKFRTFRYSML